MLTMSDFQMPRFSPFKTAATPQDMKQASEKVVNFWVGALSPMWVPFWAATSFGMGAWAVSQSLGKSEDLLKDLPLSTRWPGFMGSWQQAQTGSDSELEVSSPAFVAETATKPVKTVKIERSVAKAKPLSPASLEPFAALPVTEETDLAFKDQMAIEEPLRDSLAENLEEVVPENVPEIVPEVVPVVVHEVSQEIPPEIKPEVKPEISPEISPEDIDKVVPHMAAESAQIDQTQTVVVKPIAKVEPKPIAKAVSAVKIPVKPPVKSSAKSRSSAPKTSKPD